MLQKYDKLIDDERGEMCYDVTARFAAGSYVRLLYFCL